MDQEGELLALSLRAWPSPDTSKDELPTLISRINQQVGSFRNISESKLEEQIREGDAVDTELQSQHDASLSKESEVKSRTLEIATAQQEMLKQITHAYSESWHALNFVSLVLSKTNPRQVETTIDQHLKQNLPMGCIAAEIVQTPERSGAEINKMQMVSIGWKMQSLKSTADSLLRSATRLGQEIGRETKYWEQILAVKEHGWSLCRLPREKHTLGVRFGFAEAHSDFGDRGLAALRRDKDGNVQLDRGVLSKDRILRIRVLANGNAISSHGKLPEQASEDTPVEKLILKARNSIFDEELHYELHREARNYANQGIRCIGDKILLPYENEKQIEIDILSSTDEELPPCSEDLVSSTIAISLRILLSHAHRQNLRRRSQRPPVIKEGETPRPIYSILKPIVENLQDLSTLRQLKQFLDRLSETLSAAALSLKIEVPTTRYKLPSKTSSVAMSSTEALVSALTVPLRSAFTIHLPSSKTTIKLETVTSFQPLVSGTNFQISVLVSSPGSNISTSSIPTSSFFQLKDNFLHIVKLDILEYLVSRGDGWKTTLVHAGQIKRLREGRQERIVLHLEEDGLRMDWAWAGNVGGNHQDGRIGWGAGINPGENTRGLLGAIEGCFT